MEQVAHRTYKRRLRSVLIHRPVQREFTLVVISLLIVSALTIGFVIHATIRGAMMGGGYRFGTISPYEVMSEVSYDLIARVSIVLFVTLLIIVIFGIFFLHRVAGPVYRFQGILRRISRGEIPDEFRLREGDFFSETAADLNQVLRILRERREQAVTFRGRVEEAIRKSPSPQITSILSEIRDAFNRMAQG